MSSHKCSKCNYTSKTKGLVKKHIDNVIRCKGADLLEDIVKVKCDVCNKEFDTEKLMTQHKKKCVEKKTLIVPQYLDPVQVQNGLTTFGDILLSAVKRIELLENENKELKKRLDKVEGVNNEEEEDNNAEENLCEHYKVIKFIPTSKEQIKLVLREHECGDYKNIVVTINGQRNLEINAIVQKEGIEVDGNINHYNAGKKEKSTNDLKVIIKKYCSNVVKTGQTFCKEHQ